jgi:uncharacterized membrane protein YkgB
MRARAPKPRHIPHTRRWHHACSGRGSMSILSIIIVIVVVGVLLWALNSFIPMDGKVKSILNVVVVVLLIIWLLQAFGLLNVLRGVHV